MVRYLVAWESTWYLGRHDQHAVNGVIADVCFYLQAADAVVAALLSA